MLQQILRDMWVDPEILAELDETQKQTLFCKMREEQVRRWQIWDQKLSKEETDQPKQKNGKKQVTFMHGEDGEPWVWVMGEHPDDKSIDSMLEEEARARALAQARQEAHQLRKSVEKELTQLIDYTPLDSLEQVWVMGEHPDDKSIDSMLEEEARARALAQARQEAHQLRKSVEKELTQLIDYTPLDSLEQKFELSPKNVESIEEALDIYCTVDELRQRIGDLEPEVAKPEDKYDDVKLGLNKGTLHFNFIEGKRDGLQELSIAGDADGVSSRVLAWERRVAGARAGDLLRGLRARRARALRDERLGAQDDAAWREQERKAKEAEAARREIARAAREAHRRAAQPAPPAPPAQPAQPAPDPAGGGGAAEPRGRGALVPRARAPARRRPAGRPARRLVPRRDQPRGGGAAAGGARAGRLPRAAVGARARLRAVRARARALPALPRGAPRRRLPLARRRRALPPLARGSHRAPHVGGHHGERRRAAARGLRRRRAARAAAARASTLRRGHRAHFPLTLRSRQQ